VALGVDKDTYPWDAAGSGRGRDLARLALSSFAPDE